MEIVIENEVLGIREQESFTPAKGVITHVNPDLDALAAVNLFRHYGIRIEKILFKSAGKGGLVEGKTPEEWLKEGYILIDMGAGIASNSSRKLTHLDHHPTTVYPDQCATTICLDLITSRTENGEMAKFVEFVRNRDLRGGTQVFLDLAHICKILAPKIAPSDLYLYMTAAIDVWLNQKPDKALFLEIFSEFERDKKEIPFLLKRYVDNVRNDKTPNIPDLLRITSEKTRDIIRFALEEAYQDQLEFQEAQNLFGKANKVTFGDNKFLVFTRTDNGQFMKVALKEGATIIIIENTREQVQMFTQKGHRVNVKEIAGAIRCEEARANNNHLLIGSDELQKDGVISDAPIWFLSIRGGMLLNGSKTTPGQEPTKLGLEKIVEITLKVLNGYMPYCHGGKYPCCGPVGKCDVYGWALEVCQKHQKTTGLIILRPGQRRKLNH